jgi:hypothetical protein
MKMNRRNALLGLGAILTGGGALFGSGAFSQVQAERQVNLDIAGDSSAALGLSQGTGAAEVVSTADTNDASGNVSVISFSKSDLNADALTRFDNALSVTNNDSTAVDFYVKETNGVGNTSNADTVLDFERSSDGTEITSSGTGGTTISLSASETRGVNVVVDLQRNDDETDFPDTVTLVAE